MDRETQKHCEVEALIMGFEDGCAMLRNGHGEFRWPATHLPAGSKIGQTVVLTVKDPQSEESGKLAALRKLLEELIN